MFPCFDGDLPVCCPDCHISLWWSRWDASASCVLFVISAEQRQWQPEWRMSSGWHSPFSHTFTQQNAVWLPFVTQIQMWPANKGSSVLSNLKPKADFLNCCLLCLFVLNMSGFSQKVPQALFETLKSLKKHHKRLIRFGTIVLAGLQFTVGSGLWFGSVLLW